MVFQNNFIHMQPLIQAVRRCQAYTKARGDSITSKIKDTVDKKKEQKTHTHTPVYYIYLDFNGSLALI